MTEIERRTSALVNEVLASEGPLRTPAFYVHKAVLYEALCITLEQNAALQAEFDQYKRDVSNTVTDWKWRCGFTRESLFDRFILPKPVDPVLDGLALAVEDVLGTVIGAAEAAKLRNALEARGVKTGVGLV